MIKIEFYRFFYSRRYLYVLVMTSLIILLNYVLVSVFDLDTDEQVLSYYNSFTQFTFLLVPSIFATVINEDYIKGYYAFFRQQGYTRKNYFISKIIIAIIVSISIALIFYIINFMKPEVEVVTLLLFGNIVIIFTACIMASFIFLKPLYSILAVYVYFFLGSIANFSKLLTGLWLLPDKNSIASSYVANLYSYPWDNKNINDITDLLNIFYTYLITLTLMVIISYVLYIVKLNKRYF